MDFLTPPQLPLAPLCPSPTLLSPPSSSHLWARRRTRSTSGVPPTSPTLDTRCHGRACPSLDPADDDSTSEYSMATTPSSARSPGFWTTVACLAVIAGVGTSPGLASPVPAAGSIGSEAGDVTGLPVFAAMQVGLPGRDAMDAGGPSAVLLDLGRERDQSSTASLFPRQDISQDAKSSSSSSTDSPDSDASSSSSADTADTPTSTNSSLPSAPTASLAFPTSSTSTDLSAPQPFDTTLSYNLSDGCVTFFAGFLQDPRMTGGFNDGTGCLSFGLLQSASSQWKKIANNATLLNTALSDICLEPMSMPTTNRAATCSSWMAGLATAITKKGACAGDLADGNAVATSALNGFRNYDLMQSAACLTNPDTGRYCYLEAVNAAQPDDGYLYNLATGQMLPPTTTPSCSKCSKALLDTLASAVKSGSNMSYASSLPKALANATTVVNQQCGVDWVAWVATSGSGQTVGLHWLIGMVLAVAGAILASY